MSWLSPRQRASIRIADLYRLADHLRSYGVVLPAKDWLWCLAHILSSAPEGNIFIGIGRKRKPPRWHGLTWETLLDAAARCGLHFSIDDYEEIYEKVTKWRETRPPMSNISIARKLGITEELRREAKLRMIMGHDETKDDRLRKRRQANTVAHAEARREAGAMPQSESIEKLKPWEQEGISRRTWYSRKAKGQNVPNSKDHDCTVSNCYDHDCTVSSAPSSFLQRNEDEVVQSSAEQQYQHPDFTYFRCDSLYDDMSDEELNLWLIDRDRKIIPVKERKPADLWSRRFLCLDGMTLGDYWSRKEPCPERGVCLEPL